MRLSHNYQFIYQFELKLIEIRYFNVQHASSKISPLKFKVLMQSNYNLNIQQNHIFNPNEICLKCICFSGKHQFHFQFKKYILNVSMNVNNLPDVQKHNAARSSYPYLFGCVFYRQ